MNRDFGRPEIRDPFWPSMPMLAHVSPKALKVIKANIAWNAKSSGKSQSEVNA